MREKKSLDDLNHRSIIQKAPFMGAFFDLFLPNTCLICSETIEADSLICRKCLESIASLKPSGTFKKTRHCSRIYYYDLYDSPLTDIIKRYKYSRHILLGRFLAYFVFILLSYWRIESPVIPVPSHRRAVADRGFSAAENILFECRKLYMKQLKFLSPVIRTGEYKPQASLKGARLRRENAERSFKIKRGVDIPERLCLFDDIITTGSTLDRIAGLMKRNTKEITGVVLVNRGG